MTIAAQRDSEPVDLPFEHPAVDDWPVEDSFVPPFPPRPEAHGPLLTRLLAFRRNALSAFKARDFSTRHKFCQPVLRRRIHFCNHPDGVRETLHRQHSTFERKTPQQRRMLTPLLGDGLFVSDGPLWAERRAAVAPIVHGRRVETFFPAMRETVVEWCADWRRAGDGATLDLLFEMGELTAEIISRTVFGRRLGRAHTHEIIAGFADYVRRADTMDILSFLGVPDDFPRLSLGRTRAARRRVHQVIDGIIDAYEQGGGDEDAFIGALFRAKDARGRPFDRRAIRNEAIVIFMAGHETTANTLAWAFYLVSQSPRVAGRLQDELATVLGGRVPEFADVARLAYTRAIIEETLRLYPPVPFLGRTATADGTMMGHPIGKGDLLVVTPWLIHRNRDLWRDPDHFIPERFLESVCPRPNKYAYIPFASGPRVCPGLTFAMVESVLALATLQQAFRVELAAGTCVETDCRVTLRPSSPLSMTVTERRAA